MRTALGHIFLARLWEVFKRYIVTGTMAGELPILPITATKLALQFPLPVLTCLELEFNCQSGVWSGAGNSQIVSATATAWRFPSTTAWCPAGKKVVGGGATCSTPEGSIWLVHSLPIGDNGWSGTCDTTQKQNASIVVYATCL